MYCSRECQKADWTTEGQCHKFYCCKAGELGHCIEIKPSKGKGLGLFAKRDFAKNDIIIAERALLSDTGREWNPYEFSRLKKSEQEAFCSLSGDTMYDKYEYNKFGGNYEIHIHISRINHDCIGNSSYIPHRGAEAVVAKRDIKAGEEITFAYVHMLYMTPEKRRNQLRKKYGFECKLQCSLCSNPDLDKRAEALSLKQHRYLTYVHEFCNGRHKMDINYVMEMASEIRKMHDELNVHQSPRIQFLNQLSVCCMICKKVKVARRLLNESMAIAVPFMSGDMEAPAVREVNDLKAVLSSGKINQHGLQSVLKTTLGGMIAPMHEESASCFL